jgi:hypothetical protein
MGTHANEHESRNVSGSSPAPGSGAGPTWIFGVAALLALAGVAAYFARPTSRAPSGTELPSIAADMTRARALAEEQGHALKQRARQGLGGRPPQGQRGAMQKTAAFSRDDLRESRRLYTEAQAEVNGCIEDLCAGLGQRFQEGDAAPIRLRLEKAARKINTFLASSHRLGGPHGAVPDLMTPTVARFWRLVDGSRTANQQALDQIRADLERCRLRDWDQL